MQIKPNTKNTTSIYIKSLEIKNLRTFGDVVLEFEKPDGTLPRWTLILGDNGIGKSSLLQCIAWMKPDLPDQNDDLGQNIKKSAIEPTINFEENETLERLVRKGINVEKEHTFIKGIFLGGHKLPGKKLPKGAPWCYSSMKIELGADHKLKDVHHKFDTNSDDLFLTNEVFIFAYSASRVLGKANLNEAYMKDTITSFLTDSTVLYDAEEVLHTINYAAFGADENEKEKYQKYLSSVKQAFKSILPDIQAETDIEITTPKLVKNQIKQGEILITTRHGKKIAFKDFSLGYKTVMSWIVDLSWRLFNEFPKSKDPFKEPAICIVDEVDLHLHPKWQRDIIQNLSEHFPNIQFIATAHSPLMVQAALRENYAVLRLGQSGVDILNEPKGIDGWRVDQILTSEFFDLKTSRGIEYEEMLRRQQELNRIKKPTKAQREELDELTQKMTEFPIGENPEEIENRKLISEVVEKIKTKKIKIEL
ncbi:hypothetical protein D0C36_00820 [Mucilaginibacter conchicola]|uniref:Endonuclease GajA/Old nuclease/RecF-like AAA domain-containing protein n=1 Tax=Mucilaginibacter conchicola TaxID=2303333 RepID=A0A372NVU3_9SPHI|nr:AAA family ATPase [Mucilaginibacter conchicola]RFZ94132.1 hypothetical protein D0C36_00820 [Mucilaginibacter conchicola]